MGFAFAEGFTLLLWAASVVLCGAGLFIALANWAVLFINLRLRRQKQDRHVSFTPLVGPVLGTLGLLACPARGAAKYIWLYWVFDFGTFVLLLSLVILALTWLRGVFKRAALK